MTSSREPTVFWCSHCKDRHAGDCPTVSPPPGDVYLLKGQTSLRYDHALHGDWAKLIADGYRVYDPMGAPGDDCRATLRTHMGPPCRHGYSWQCPRVPRPKRPA